MPLTPGTRLGPYEIVAPLGAGGMGEVYRATDTRLDRTVAVKVLPAHVADRPEARQRFEREARAVSSLNHPHICALYDIGNQDGIDFLVMEYLEGETLGKRLASGALPVVEALRYAVQVADALDKAHRQGVFHRDIKPGNIMLTPAGAKLLDFGLAKLRPQQGDPAVSGLSMMPTEDAALTAKGTILGTFQYMAPEQLEGKDADARSEIFSFGAVLYEMLTGRKAFGGRSPASLITAIMSSEPPAVSTLQPVCPPALDRLVRRCLAKPSDDRWQTARDLMLELQALDLAAPQGPAAAAAARPARFVYLGWILAAVFFVAAVALGIAWFSRAPTPADAVRFYVHPPEKTVFSGFRGPGVISPDGRRLVSAASGASTNQLLVRSLDSLAMQPIGGTDGANYPFWSPDSRYIGFFADGKLKKIDVLGGPAQTLCDAPAGQGASWTRDSVIVFTRTTSSILYRVSSAGGPATPVTAFEQSRQEVSHRWPYFLPDGKHFLFFARSQQPENSGFYAGSLESKQVKRLLAGDSSVAYCPPRDGGPGLLLFAREGTLMAHPFDARRLELSGEPFPVVEQVSFNTLNSLAGFSVASNGTLVYLTGSGAYESTELAWFDRTGKRLGAAGPQGAYSSVDLAPDGRRAAVKRTDPQSRNIDIWVYEFARGINTRFTFHPAVESNPVWSPDGKRIAFVSMRDGGNRLYQKASDSEGNEEPLDLHQSGLPKYPYHWSPDGRFLLYSVVEKAGVRNLWVLPLSGDRKPAPYIESQFSKTHAQFSPDGARVAYASMESGRNEIYVRAFPGTAPGSGGQFQVSTSGGSQPRWRRDGKELFYVDAERRLMSVEVTTAPRFEARAPKPLFQARLPGVSNTYQHQYAVAPDGQRFLIVTSVEEAASTPLTVALNFAAGLKR